MKNKTAYLLLAAAVIIFISDTVQKLPYSPDDTFIYMQYARNISDGHGFSFNAGEPSYGVTSPFWVIILTIPYFIGINAFWFSKILDLICAILAVIVFYRFSKMLFDKNPGNFLPLLAASLFVLNIWFIRWSFTGMETNLAVFLMLLILFLYYRKSYNICFFLLGLFFLIRPEVFVLFLIILLAVIIEKYKSFKTEYKNIGLYIFLFALCAVPFLVFAELSFGTFLANTTLGKSTLTLNINTITAQAAEIVKTLAPSSGVEIILSLVFLIFVFKNKSFRKYMVLILWPAGLLLLYVITDADIISRYFMIIIPVFTLLAVKTIEQMKNRMAGGVVLYILILVISLFSFYRYVKPHTDNFSKGVEECLIPIGEWFDNNTPEDTRILVNDVGAIGYYSNRYVIDAAALINRDLKLNREIMSTSLEERKNPYNLVKFVKADYVIERDSSGEGIELSIGDKKLEMVFYKVFPGLGISDESPKYYKVYKVMQE